MLNGAVLARGIHRLKNQQQRIAAMGVEQILVLAQLLDVLGEQFLVMFIGLIHRLDLGGQFFETHLGAFVDPEFLGGNFHGMNLGHPGEGMKGEMGWSLDGLFI